MRALAGECCALSLLGVGLEVKWQQLLFEHLPLQPRNSKMSKKKIDQAWIINSTNEFQTTVQTCNFQQHANSLTTYVVGVLGSVRQRTALETDINGAAEPSGTVLLLLWCHASNGLQTRTQPEPKERL